jgi:sugar lactone lactonase YvrE
VRRIAPNGIITNFAGFVSGTACVPTATTGCTPTLVKLNKPRGVASDAAGNIYIAGYSSNQVMKVSVSTGLLYLVAGTGTAGTPTAANGDGGLATSALLDQPRGVWADTLGNIYIADTSDFKIREVDTTGHIQTIAGTGVNASSGDGGLATVAQIANPQGVMTDANLNVYIAETARVRVICVTCVAGSPLVQLLTQLGIASPTNGDIYTIAGGGAAAYSGTAPVLANTITLSPQKLAIDSHSNIYISDGSGAVWFLDSSSGNIRPIAGNTATNCAGATDSVGDGCPATAAVIGDGGNGIGVGTDTLGNIYISDTKNARIRKVTTNLQAGSIATAATTTQPVQLHFIAGDTLGANGLAFTSTEWALSAANCTTNADTTSDCFTNVGFTPAVPGARSTPLTVTSSHAYTAYLGLTGIGLGGGATLDPASRVSFGANLAIAGIATDNLGNVYVSDAISKKLLRFGPSAVAQGSSAIATTLTTLTNPGAIAVDARGYVYVADTATGLITQIAPGGTPSTLPVQFTTPAGLAIDTLDNLYVSDSAAQAVYQISLFTGAQRTLALGTLVAPSGLAIDPAGNLLVADPGAPAIYRFNLQSNTRTTLATPAVAPLSVVTDAAGNLLIADTASILAVPASVNSAAFKVASLAPSSLAIDPAGDLYTGSAGAVLKLVRTQGATQFANAAAAPQTVNLLESGNQLLNLSSIVQSDAADFSLLASASADCTLNGTLPASLAVGGDCLLTASYAPTSFLSNTDTVTFNGNLSNGALSTPSSIQLVLTVPVSACNVTHTGSTMVSDVQREINESLGAVAATDDLNTDGAVNVVDVQIVINAVLGLNCSGQ